MTIRRVQWYLTHFLDRINFPATTCPTSSTLILVNRKKNVIKGRWPRTHQQDSNHHQKSGHFYYFYFAQLLPQSFGKRRENWAKKNIFFFAQFSLLFPNSSSHLVQRTHLNVPTHAHGNGPCQEKCAAEESDPNDVHHTVSWAEAAQSFNISFSPFSVQVTWQL